MADVKIFFCCIAGYEKVWVWAPHTTILTISFSSYNLKRGYAGHSDFYLIKFLLKGNNLGWCLAAHPCAKTSRVMRVILIQNAEAQTSL